MPSAVRCPPALPALAIALALALALTGAGCVCNGGGGGNCNPAQCEDGDECDPEGSGRCVPVSCIPGFTRCSLATTNGLERCLDDGSHLITGSAPSELDGPPEIYVSGQDVNCGYSYVGGLNVAQINPIQ